MATVTKALALDETLEGVRQALLALPGGGNVTTVALNLSDAYDPTAAYAVGDLCIKDNVLCKCNTAIASGGEAWNAAHWTQTTVDDILHSTVTVTGTTPTIAAIPGVRYVCGEVTTLDITLPASGVVDVTFESGSTATVLTVTPPTGQTVRWANGFDPTSLEANTTYELLFNGVLGLAHAWHNTTSMRTRLELIADITTEEELGSIVINKDMNGNDFALSYAEAYAVLPASTPSTKEWYSYFSSGAQRYCVCSFGTGSSVIKIKQSLDVMAPNGTFMMQRKDYAIINSFFENSSQAPISIYRLTNFNSLKLPVGSHIVLLGLRR